MADRKKETETTSLFGFEEFYFSHVNGIVCLNPVLKDEGLQRNGEEHGNYYII